jgi:hypothetical protein
MSRPEPTLIKEYIKPGTQSIVQICEVENNRGLYVVVCKGKPFQYKTKANFEIDYPGWKYVRTSFANSAHAFNLATKLNYWFDTDEFEVVEMSYGTTISPNKYK